LFSFKKWIEVHFYDFLEDVKLTTIFMNFVDDNLKNKFPEVAQTLKTAIKKKLNPDTIDVEKLLELAPEPIIPSRLKADTFDFIDIDPLEITRQLCIVEFSLYKKVLPKELLNQKWNKSNKEIAAPNVLAVIRRFNKTSFWVSTCIVKTPGLKTRIALVERFIDISQNCTNLNNFSGAFAIIAGLETSAIFRMKKTWDGVSVEKKQTFENLKLILSSNKSYKDYRNRLRSSVGACIPYLGVYLSDLTFIDEGNQDIIKSTNLVNFDKRIMVSKVIVDIQQFQQLSYTLKPVPLLQSFLTNLESLTEQEIYKLSLEQEPRE